MRKPNWPKDEVQHPKVAIPTGQTATELLAPQLIRAQHPSLGPGDTHRGYGEGEWVPAERQLGASPKPGGHGLPRRRSPIKPPSRTQGGKMGEKGLMVPGAQVLEKNAWC
jgi:hypothetical protein